jgi:uncharacterized repeat protein (TIGR03803 family)
MNIEQMSAGCKISLRGFKLATVLFLTLLLVTLSPQSALGQGFQMTQIEAPGTRANTTLPIAVNTSEAVVGYGTATSGATVGFLYAGGKYTVIKKKGSNNFTRALGINGAYTVLHNLNGTTDGISPYSSLVQATEGNFYGVANGGGSLGFGTIFKVTSRGVYSVVHNFDGKTGQNPSALTQDTNGILYGDTYREGQDPKIAMARVACSTA